MMLTSRVAMMSDCLNLYKAPQTVPNSKSALRRLRCTFFADDPQF